MKLWNEIRGAMGRAEQTKTDGRVGWGVKGED